LLVFIAPQAGFALQNSERSDRVNTAIHIITTFCLAGGKSTTFVSESVSSPSGGEFRFSSDSGSFVVRSTEVEGLVNGIQSEMSALSADQANRTRDCMAPFIPQVIAAAFGEFDEKANSLVPDPGKILSNQYFHNVSVHYYLKAADGVGVTNALKRRGISFTQIASILPDSLHSNAVYCGPETPAKAIKELAFTLIESGIPVRSIARAPKGGIPMTLYVATRSDGHGHEVGFPSLSKSQIDAVNGCPDHPIENSGR
jgi:hypothetical protein